jgi:hypothetical protein
MAAGNQMRVSDAEREAATAELREHFASGRLDSEELDQRLSAAFAARTQADLGALFTDLPAGGHGQGGQGGGQGAGRPFGPGSFGPRAFGSPLGGGPSRPGQFGSRPGHQGQWQSGDDNGGQARGNAWRASAGRSASRILTSSMLVTALFIVGFLGIFGIGTGRPFGIVLLVAAFALLRRLVFIIFGRRGGRGGCGRRRR